MAQVYNIFWVKFVLIVLFGVLMQESTSYVLIEGDKMDESSVRNVQTPQIEDVRSKRAIMNKRRLWKFGVIPYEIDDDFGFDRITQIKAAMKHWEDVTCIIFVERDLIEHEDYIRFTEILECTCCSDVGKIGDRQVIGVTNCGGVGDIIHELGHVIGFHHEYERPDRDEYIVIIEEEPTYEDIFFGKPYLKLSPRVFDTLGEPFDFDSIMHEYIERFTVRPKKGKNGIVPKMGRNERLSVMDIRKTKKLYKCPECGRTYLAKKVEFTSPQYYNNLIDRKYYCEWRIKANKGERILLDITDLDTFLLDSSDCGDDYLEVFDGYWHKSPLLARFCGDEIPDNIVSSANYMFIRYVSSHTEHGHRGFVANYETFSI